jgi:hypothetical protein
MQLLKIMFFTRWERDIDSCEPLKFYVQYQIMLKIKVLLFLFLGRSMWETWLTARHRATNIYDGIAKETKSQIWDCHVACSFRGRYGWTLYLIDLFRHTQ